MVFDKRPALVAIPPSVDGSSAKACAIPNIQVLNISVIRVAEATIYENRIFSKTVIVAWDALLLSDLWIWCN